MLRITQQTHLISLAAVLCLAVTVCGGFVVTPGSVPSNDAVYCPLQKRWVAKTQPKPAVDLGNICAGASEKQRFVEAGAKGLGQGDVSENGFFEFAVSGVVGHRSQEPVGSVFGATRTTAVFSNQRNGDDGFAATVVVFRYTTESFALSTSEVPLSDQLHYSRLSSSTNLSRGPPALYL